MANAAVELIDVRKSFGETRAVDGVNLRVAAGEFLTLLGPSGCGKTTTLRLIGGFERPTSGSIVIGGEEMTARPPHKRPVNTVFQNYALFPHLTVAENVAYGLRMAGVPAGERTRRVGEALAMARLPGVEARKPAELSGGQQQRVALARALVNRPKVVLLDEPLGALDLKLRQAMQLELKELNRNLGATFIYVTHDQDEALTMSDRIAVMHEGRILQVASPESIYETPATRFVADFIGETNFLTGQLTGIEDGLGNVAVDRLGTIRARRPDEGTLGGKVAVAVRPEKIAFISDLGRDGLPASWNRLRGRVTEAMYLGTHTQFVLRLPNDDKLVVRRQNATATGSPILVGADVEVVFSPDAATVLIA